MNYSKENCLCFCNWQALWITLNQILSSHETLYLLQEILTNYYYLNLTISSIGDVHSLRNQIDNIDDLTNYLHSNLMSEKYPIPYQ